MYNLNQIEAQIAKDRDQLTSTLDQLTNTLSPDHIATKLSSSVESYGGEIGRQAIGAAKQNPAAFALLAAGVGLLLTGAGTSAERERVAAMRYRANDPQTAMEGFDERVAVADDAIKSSMATKSAAPSSSWLRENLEYGLESLPAPARRRVIKARKAAIAAQQKVEAKAKQIANSSRNYHSQSPLSVGAIALGIGAVAGALLPSTRREDALLGQHRDALMSNAQNALSAELSKLKGAVEDGVEDVANRLQNRPPAKRNAAS